MNAGSLRLPAAATALMLLAATVTAVMVLAATAWAQVPGGQAQQPRPRPAMQVPKGVRMLSNLEYARVGEKRLLLDLYLPQETVVSFFDKHLKGDRP